MRHSFGESAYADSSGGREFYSMLVDKTAYFLWERVAQL